MSLFSEGWCCTYVSCGMYEGGRGATCEGVECEAGAIGDAAAQWGGWPELAQVGEEGGGGKGSPRRRNKQPAVRRTGR